MNNMAGNNDNRFGLKKPEVKPPVQILNYPMNLLICGDLMYFANPMKNIYIPIPPEWREMPEELAKAQEERRQFEEDLKEFNLKVKELDGAYREELEKAMKEEMSKAQAKAAEAAQKKVKKSFKDRLGL